MGDRATAAVAKLLCNDAYGRGRREGPQEYNLGRNKKLQILMETCLKSKYDTLCSQIFKKTCFLGVSIVLRVLALHCSKCVLSRERHDIIVVFRFLHYENLAHFLLYTLNVLLHAFYSFTTYVYSNFTLSLLFFLTYSLLVVSNRSGKKLQEDRLRSKKCE